MRGTLTIICQRRHDVESQDSKNKDDWVSSGINKKEKGHLTSTRTPKTKGKAT